MDIYVDDILITWNDLKYVADNIAQLRNLISMKSLGPLNFFVGVKSSRSNGGYTWHKQSI